MNLSSISNMNLHLRNMELQSMWDMRRQNQDYTTKGQLRLDQMFEQMYGANAEEHNGSDQKLSDIMQKYYYGSKLTSEEMDYLRTKNPQIYNEILREEQEQKAFEKELKRCETKEDVERLKMNRINGALAGISKIENNPNIPKAQKLAAFARAKRCIDNVMESTERFIESGEYAKLPTDSEKALAEKKEAEREELRAEAMQEAIREKTEALAKTSEEETVPPESKPEHKEADETDAMQKQKLTELERELDFPRFDSVLPEAERHVESAEERKVKRARAKAAYAPASDITPASAGIDKKA
ncbi:MAG: hypothetical protein IKA89_09490 [Anaerotignum sp.]|nr:hypothetical protein [Anaerotignum sp.]